MGLLLGECEFYSENLLNEAVRISSSAFFGVWPEHPDGSPVFAGCESSGRLQGDGHANILQEARPMRACRKGGQGQSMGVSSDFRWQDGGRWDGIRRVESDG